MPRVGRTTLETERITLGVLIGSLRRNSINRRLFNELVSMAPDHITLDEIPIGGLPHYNEDLDHNPPALVTDFRDAVRAADGIVFITPEYNHTIPGVMKNAIDWASRPMPGSPMYGKPGAILGGSAGRSGTMRAQLTLRQILPVSNVLVMNKPDVYVTFAEGKFGADGRLSDTPTLNLLDEFLRSFARWIDLVRQGAVVAV